MPVDQDFANRIREELSDVDGITEKRMFGGLAFLLHGNLAVGIMSTGNLMVRVGPDGTDEALAKPNTRLLEMRGRSMTGWVIVAAEGIRAKRQLGPWVKRGVAFASSLEPKAS
jgi:TfoX/Sxy family transcriptional regulator of competence genes